MRDSRGWNPDRRSFMAGTAAAAGMVAATRGSAHAGSGLESLAMAGKSVLLHDPRYVLPTDFLSGFESRGTQVVAIQGDPVWLWRRAAHLPMRDPATQLFGVTGWADLLVFRGLGAETRRHLRYEKLTDSGAFIWLIG